MTSVGRSLQAIGYNRLALALLKDHQDLPISMDLAWRTQSWDVPEPQDPSVPESQVFRALRAVHRQRDQPAALNIVKENLTQATSLLGHASIENMEKVGSAWRQCLCLREVQHWYDTYQPLVNDGRWEDPKWQRILWTPAHLECVAFSL
jgi:ataxia telangiectasia mutated family protein